MREEGLGGWVSANENSCAHHVTWSPNKLWISNSIFKFSWRPNLSSSLTYSEAGLLQSCKMITFKPALWLRIRIRRIRMFWASRIRITINHYWYGSGSFHYQAKKVRNASTTIVLWLFYDFLSLKTDVKVHLKSKKQKNLEKNLFLLTLWKPQHRLL